MDQKYLKDHQRECEHQKAQIKIGGFLPYLFVQEEEKFRLLVRAEDYVEAQVEEHLAKFQAECAAEFEGQ